MKFSSIKRYIVTFFLVFLSNCILAKEVSVDEKYIGNWITVSAGKMYSLKITATGFAYQVGNTKIMGAVKQEEDRLLIVDPGKGRNDGGYCTINAEGELIAHDNGSWELAFTREQ